MALVIILFYACDLQQALDRANARIIKEFASRLNETADTLRFHQGMIRATEKHPFLASKRYRFLARLSSYLFPPLVGDEWRQLQRDLTIHVHNLLGVVESIRSRRQVTPDPLTVLKYQRFISVGRALLPDSFRPVELYSVQPSQILYANVLSSLMTVQTPVGRIDQLVNRSVWRQTQKEWDPDLNLRKDDILTATGRDELLRLYYRLFLENQAAGPAPQPVLIHGIFRQWLRPAGYEMKLMLEILFSKQIGGTIEAIRVSRRGYRPVGSLGILTGKDRHGLRLISVLCLKERFVDRFCGRSAAHSTPASCGVGRRNDLDQ